jgi:hypothetical protein
VALGAGRHDTAFETNTMRIPPSTFVAVLLLLLLSIAHTTTGQLTTLCHNPSDYTPDLVFSPVGCVTWHHHHLKSTPFLPSCCCCCIA